MAMMLAAGIQVDDALSLMLGDSGDGPLYDAASAVLERVQRGEPLAEAVEQCGYFPAYAAQLVAAGEAAGRTESVLKSLAVYYETQDKLEKRLKSAVIYPAVLLFLMAGVLAVLVARVLPVFTGVYTGLAGSVAASSYAYITAANIIGWASLCLVIVLTALLLTGAAAARTQRGNGLFRTLFEKLPYTSAAAAAGGGAIYWALATFTASGMNTDTAMERASDMVRHRALRASWKAAAGRC
ncbi:MAG: type II secretion system F family protein [Ruthenibacterium lactatiformans]